MHCSRHEHAAAATAQASCSVVTTACSAVRMSACTVLVHWVAAVLLQGADRQLGLFFFSEPEAQAMLKKVSFALPCKLTAIRLQEYSQVWGSLPCAGCPLC